MSSKKDKLLESAQKFIAKGQLDRAIKDYEQIVALDSGDIRHRQKLAELLVRANRKEEAIGEYEAIGKHYSDHAFYLKAIAVYKQIQKLDSGNVKVTMSLASLNEKQGLIGNALAEYNNALSYYQKTRQLPEAIKVLEQMLTVDPGNLNTLLKYAETYFTAGIHEKAYEQFTRLAVFLGKSGDDSAFRQICNRIITLFPSRRDFMLELMATLVEDGCVDTAIPHLLAMTGDDSNNRRAWELLAEAYGQQGDQERRSATLKRMAGLFPGESLFTEKLGQDAPDAGQRELTGAVGAVPDAVSLKETGQPESPDTETWPAADEVPVVAEPGDSGHGEPWEEIDLSLADEQGVPGLAPDVDELPVSFVGETAVVEEPAQTTVESAGPDSGEPQETPSLSADYSEVDLEIEEEEVDEGVELESAYADESPLLDGFAEIDLEIDVEESGLPEPHASDAGDLSLSGEFSEIDLEIDVEEDSDSGLPEPHASDAGDLSLSGEFSEIDLEIDVEEDADSALPESHASGSDELSLSGEISEIDLEIDVEEAADSGLPEPHASDSDELSLSGEFSEIDLEVDAEEARDGITFESQVEYAADGSSFPEIDLVKIGGEAPSLSLDNLLEEAAAAEEFFPDVAGPESEPTLEMPAVETGMPDAGADAPVGDELFDLGQELRLEGLGIPDEDIPGSGPAGKYSLDGLFSAFKEAVDQQLDHEDTETHYNLGIAYKEMGLYDDAIAEFQAAARAAERAADCLTLQGICHRDKGDVDRAEEAFRKGMTLAGLSTEEALSLKYELALLLESIGRTDDALQLFREVRAVNSDFREIIARIVAIAGDSEAKAAEELELLELEVEEEVEEVEELD